MLSPLDWAMVEAWKERGIPLRIAVRAIETVFDRVDRNPNQARSIKSLSYCRDEVENQYEEWLSAQVGKTSSDDEGVVAESEVSDGFTEEKIEEHLSNLCSSLAGAKTEGKLREMLNDVSDKLEDLKSLNADSETIEKSLSELESVLDEALLENIDAKLVGEIKLEVEEELSGYKTKMDEEVYERTFELMLLKKLREESNVPRLSLFYL